jgi:hypothetical protein
MPGRLLTEGSFCQKSRRRNTEKWAFPADAEPRLTGRNVKSAAVLLQTDWENARIDTHSAKWRLVPRLLGLGQDGAATGGYAAPSSPEFREKQLARFRELAPEIDIVITTALIPGRPAPKLWLGDMVRAMKIGSVIVDLAAERGGNCALTVPDQKVVTDNGVTVIGYTDFPSRMAVQASTLYSTNIRHFLTDLTPRKDGVIVQDMEDDVIRGATVTHGGAITYPPPPPKVQAISAAQPKEKPKELTPAEKRAQEAAAFRSQTRTQVGLLATGGLLIALVGAYGPRQGFVPNPHTSGATGRIGRRQFLQGGRTDLGCALNPSDFGPPGSSNSAGLRGALAACTKLQFGAQLIRQWVSRCMRIWCESLPRSVTMARAARVNGGAPPAV